MAAGALVLSLDFELHWGVRDSRSLESYRDNLLGVRQAVPALLDLFAARGIHATWATVGMLFCRTKRELEETMPARLPAYEDASLSPYQLGLIGEDEAADPYHYAPTLVQHIAKTAGQELATHTFSHFYCLERGQTAADFDADLASAEQAAARFGVTFRSIVFPRNQENPAYRSVLAGRGIKAYRSTGRWPYTASLSVESRAKRIVRFADAYAPVAGSRTYQPVRDAASGLVDVPGSAFLRPYSPKLRHLDALKVARLRGAMTHAAELGEVFHLWWHPHNFGTHLVENLATLTALLDHFARLRTRHGMESLTMAEAAATA